MNPEEQKLKVVSTKTACAMLGCSRTTFYNTYKKRLTQYTTQNEHQNLFLLSEVEDLVKSKDKPCILKEYELVK